MVRFGTRCLGCASCTSYDLILCSLLALPHRPSLALAQYHISVECIDEEPPAFSCTCENVEVSGVTPADHAGLLENQPSALGVYTWLPVRGGDSPHEAVTHPVSHAGLELRPRRYTAPLL